MKITFDPDKNAKNIAERDLSFEQVKAFDFNAALIWQDVRYNYPEPRWSALGRMGDDRVYSVVFTMIPDGIRVISFRKANKREVKQYEQAA